MIAAPPCPKCGASLPADESSLTCRFCGATLTVERSRENAPSAAAPVKGHALLYAALGVPAVLLGVLALAVLMRRDAPPSSPATPPSTTMAEPPSEPPAQVPSTAAPAASASSAPAASPFADVDFEFGEKGKGPGQLDGATQIAVDPNGDSYVSSSHSRRLQHFDPAGKFVGSFELGEGTQDNLIQGLAATYDGFLWATRGGDLVKLQLPGGKVVKTIPNQKPRVSYEGVAVDSTNGLYATNIGANTFISTDGKLPQSDNLRKLDKDGNLRAAWKDVGGHAGASLAVDAEGNLYVAERRSTFIDIIDPSGKVKARFAGAHGLNGGGIVVDGKGHIFTGGRGITVFDMVGTKLGQIGTDEVKCIALGPKGRLYALIQNGPIRVFTLH